MTESIDFTEGRLGRNLFLYALPLFIGNLFQQLYNAADILIVGNFLGPAALAAVSSTSSLIFMLVGFFNGFSVGAGVVIARAFGAKDSGRIDKAVHTDIAFGLIAGTAISALASLLTPYILVWISTPEDIRGLSSAYFRIYSAGIVFSVMYNILMGILSAVGDSRHPLYYLIFSSAVNVALDLVFICVFGQGVASAAVATVISQALSAGLCFIRLLKGNGTVKIRMAAIRINLPQLKTIISYGLPSGLQNSILGFANTVVQSNVNTFSPAVIAGFGVYSKIEGFILLPMTTIALALATMIGQCIGAKQYERARKGARLGVLSAVAIAEALAIILFVFAEPIASLFSSDAEVIEACVRQARIEALFYFLVAITHSSAGVLRGAGKSSVPMLVILSAWCVFRIIVITAAMAIRHDAAFIYAAYPITWLLSSSLMLIYFAKADWLHAESRF